MKQIIEFRPLDLKILDGWWWDIRFLLLLLSFRPIISNSMEDCVSRESEEEYK